MSVEAITRRINGDSLLDLKLFRDPGTSFEFFDSFSVHDSLDVTLSNKNIAISSPPENSGDITAE
jgi:hypothetical protein